MCSGVLLTLLACLVPMGATPVGATPASAEPAAEAPATGRYLALGDSYASGEGVEPFLPGTNRSRPENRCHRSASAYSQLLAVASPAREFWACSGARIGNFYPGQGQWGEPGQLEHLDGATDLVTLSVGGNDMQFALVLGSCFTMRACHRALAPFAALLRDRTVDRLAALYREVLDRAPRARVLVVGYPRFVTANPSPLCRLVGLEPFEASWLVREVTGFDERLRDLVARIGSPRLEYVGTLDAFAGGEACASSRYVAGLVPRHPVYSFHPTRDGQAVLAQRVAAALGWSDDALVLPCATWSR